MNIKSECNAYCIKCATKIENDESICSKCGSRRVILGEDKIDYILFMQFSLIAVIF